MSSLLFFPHVLFERNVSPLPALLRPLSRRFAKFHRCNLAKTLPSALLPPSCGENKTIPVRPERLLKNGECFLETHFCSRPRLATIHPFMWTLTDLVRNGQGDAGTECAARYASVDGGEQKLRANGGRRSEVEMGTLSLAMDLPPFPLQKVIF
ncbi:hypothetical protein CEXT_510721 [Caerostris extrusa]|uniref:Uncharacterized protein n=1 Tax=Caerostris extrusa TaxID=172846 RepID=A0AAV4WLC0_CAEEX|nr:hypothetical protein CEXT_510721 [Caerostris extrusa]